MKAIHATVLFTAVAAHAGAASAARCFDSGIPTSVAESWGRQAAQHIPLSRECRAGMQYHTAWGTIYARDGTRYLVKPPAGWKR